MCQIRTYVPESISGGAGGGYHYQYQDSPLSARGVRKWSGVGNGATPVLAHEEWTATPISPTTGASRDMLGTGANGVNGKEFNFGPYSSLYSSPVSAREGTAPFTGREWPLMGRGEARRSRSREGEGGDGVGVRGDEDGTGAVGGIGGEGMGLGDRIELRDVKPARLRGEDEGVGVGMGRAF